MGEQFHLDLSVTNDLAQRIATNPPMPIVPTIIQEHEKQTREITEQIDRMHRERESREKAKLEALTETAKETKEIREKQDKIIDNQQRLIDYQTDQIEIMIQQLSTLKQLFYSGEDGVAVQKEIMRKLIEQEEKDHPIRNYLADKGGDIGVNALIAVGPYVLAGLKTWLTSKGINL